MPLLRRRKKNIFFCEACLGQNGVDFSPATFGHLCLLRLPMEVAVEVAETPNALKFELKIITFFFYFGRVRVVCTEQIISSLSSYRVAKSGWKL